MSGEKRVDIFSEFQPEDFSIEFLSPTWEAPASIVMGIHFLPVSQRAREKIMFPSQTEYKADAFARRPPMQQLLSKYGELIDYLWNPAQKWALYFVDQYRTFETAAQNYSGLFQRPLRFVSKSEFSKATFKEIVQVPLDQLEVYIACDWNSFGRQVEILRIHSSLSLPRADGAYRWFQKPIPWKIRTEDMGLWFSSLIAKLPRKYRPHDGSLWLQRLLDTHPEFAPKPCKGDEDWNDRSDISILFGSLDRIVSCYVCRLKREDVHSIMRRGSEVLLHATEQNLLTDTREDWRIRFFTLSASSAHMLEADLIQGFQTHFAVGAGVAGILGQTESIVVAASVSDSIVRENCSREGHKLACIHKHGRKNRTFLYFSDKEPWAEIQYVLE